MTKKSHVAQGLVKRKTTQKNHHPSKKARLVLIIGGSLVALVGIVYILCILLLFVSFPSRDCNASGKDSAAQAAHQFATEINTLRILSPPYQAASPAVDSCVADHTDTAYTSETKNYPSPGVALLQLHSTIQSRLKVQGFTQKQPLTLEAYDAATPVYVDETYTKPGSQDLTVTYTVGPNQYQCDKLRNQALDVCVSQYQARFSDFQKLNTTSVAIGMSQDFPFQ